MDDVKGRARKVRANFLRQADDFSRACERIAQTRSPAEFVANGDGTMTIRLPKRNYNLGGQDV